jgi:hypothetical protein
MKQEKQNLMKPGETFPDAIKRFLSQERNASVSVKDYENALVDTVLYQSKQYHAKNNSKTGLNPKVDVAAQSTLFENSFTYKELADALVETKVRFDNLFELPFYKEMMTIKGGAQIAKTIFSPMTQVRNVTTASFFPLMSGLIGGRTSVSDAWKLVAEDIFTTAKTDIRAINETLDDMIKRGVIDQNIQVNEMRGIINKARDGKISFESFMNNPTVKKLVDIYQGGDNIWKVYSDRFYQSALNKHLLT